MLETLKKNGTDVFLNSYPTKIYLNHNIIEKIEVFENNEIKTIDTKDTLCCINNSNY